MMLSYEYLNDAVELSNSKIPVLVIENKKIFRQALRSFFDDTVEELFTFSQDFKTFDFNKRGFFISNALAKKSQRLAAGTSKAAGYAGGS